MAFCMRRAIASRILLARHVRNLSHLVSNRSTSESPSIGFRGASNGFRFDLFFFANRRGFAKGKRSKNEDDGGTIQVVPDMGPVKSTALAQMEDAMTALSRELGKLRTGRASAGMLDHIIVETNGVKMPLNRVAVVSVIDAQTLSVLLYDPNNEDDGGTIQVVPDMGPVKSTALAQMEDAMTALSRELGKLRTGRASAGMLDHIIVETNGVKMPLNRVAVVSVIDAQTLSMLLYDPNNEDDGGTIQVVPDMGPVKSTALAQMEDAMTALSRELGKLRTGRASAGMLDHIIVETNGVKMPLNRVAVVSVIDAQTLSVLLYDPNTLKSIERAIISSPLGLNPIADGERLIAAIPPLTKENIQALCKVVAKCAEDVKQSIRRSRQKVLDSIKKAASAIPKDDVKRLEKEVEELTKRFVKSADDMCKAKEKEIGGR